MSALHVAVARYALLLANTTACVFGGSATVCGSPEESTVPAESGASPNATEPADSGGPVASQSLPPWDGKERLNILLIGADEQNGGPNTGTNIVPSLDATAQPGAMCSAPRDPGHV